MKNEFLFIGYLIPDGEMNEIIKIDKYPQIQTHKFIKNLVKGIEISKTCSFTYLSTRPVSDYPYYPKKIVRGKKWSFKLNNNPISSYEISFINISVLKIISRFIASLIDAIKIFSGKKSKKGIIVYSVHVPFMLAGFVMSKLYKIDFITIWTDPPSVISERDSLLKNYLRNIEYNISKFLMKRSSKTIVLTKELAIDFSPDTPYLVIEGIIDESESNNLVLKKTKNKLFKVVYTGSIEKKYGIENIVEAFKTMDDMNICLEIYGKGDFEEKLKIISKEYKNIKYMGFETNDKIIKIQSKADLLINVRPITENYVKYSFPSKTLEYMLSGVPVLTTKISGIPNDYFEYMYNIPDNEVDTIIREIKKILSENASERENLAKKALNFAKTKDFKPQGEKIINFLNN